MNLKPAEGLLGSPAMTAVKAHRSVIIKPIFLANWKWIHKCCNSVSWEWWEVNRSAPVGCTFAQKKNGSKGCTCSYKVPSNLRTGKLKFCIWVGITYPSSYFLMSVKSPMDPQIGAKRSVYFNWLSRCSTIKVIMLHSSSSKVERIAWILALTIARPAALPVTSHSKGLITYRPPLKEASGRAGAVV